MGLGFIGQEVARAALRSEEVELVAAVDKSPKLLGRPLTELLGVPAGKLVVLPNLAAAQKKGAVLLHATGSKLALVSKELFEALELKLCVVSSCEELSFPWFRHPELADKLDAAAKKAGVSLLGTGVNPGFVLDRLVATATQVCGPVRRIQATRIVDARTRREALQRKVGAGLSEAEFFKLVEDEQLGHVGLPESAALCALGAGIDCDDFDEEIAPVIAEEDISGGAFLVKKGFVAGIHQSVSGLSDGQERVRLELTIAVGAEPAGDRIEIDADPKVVLEIPGGVAGDQATANVMVNAAPRIASAEAGLLTVLELPAGR